MAENIVDLQCPLCGNDAPAGREKCDCGYKFANGGGSADAVEWSPGMVNTGALGDSWKSFGWLLVAGGAIGLLVSLMLETSVTTYGYDTGSVVNLDLLFRKWMALTGSLFAIGLGTFCLGVGAIVESLARKS